MYLRHFKMLIYCPLDVLSVRGRKTDVWEEKGKKGVVIKCLIGTITQCHGYPVFITKLGSSLSSFLLSANLSPSLILSVPVIAPILLFPTNPSSPSLSILPFLNRSSHSVPVFVEEPVKVAPAAVQTLMAPRCVWKTPLCSQLISCELLSQPDVFHYCRHGTNE